jgi:hypothetical protein
MSAVSSSKKPSGSKASGAGADDDDDEEEEEEEEEEDDEEEVGEETAECSATEEAVAEVATPPADSGGGAAPATDDEASSRSAASASLCAVLAQCEAQRALSTARARDPHTLHARRPSAVRAESGGGGSELWASRIAARFMGRGRDGLNSSTSAVRASKARLGTRRIGPEVTTSPPLDRADYRIPSPSPSSCISLLLMCII